MPEVLLRHQKCIIRCNTIALDSLAYPEFNFIYVLFAEQLFPPLGIWGILCAKIPSQLHTAVDIILSLGDMTLSAGKPPTNFKNLG